MRELPQLCAASMQMMLLAGSSVFREIRTQLLLQSQRNAVAGIQFPSTKRRREAPNDRDS